MKTRLLVGLPRGRERFEIWRGLFQRFGGNLNLTAAGQCLSVSHRHAPPASHFIPPRASAAYDHIVGSSTIPPLPSISKQLLLLRRCLGSPSTKYIDLHRLLIAHGKENGAFTGIPKFTSIPCTGACSLSPCIFLMICFCYSIPRLRPNNDRDQFY